LPLVACGLGDQVPSDAGLGWGIAAAADASHQFFGLHVLEEEPGCAGGEGILVEVAGGEDHRLGWQRGGCASDKGQWR
jgi:hypothetical protein